MNGICTSLVAQRIYPRKSNIVNYKDEGAFSSSVSKKVENNFDLSDMYVITHQSTDEEWIEDLALIVEKYKADMHKGCLEVPVAGDMKELMECIEEALANGETLRSVLQNRIDKYARECGIDGVVAVGGGHADLIRINPDTGEVVDSHAKGRCIGLKKLREMDFSIVKSEADDLATFLRYTVFKKETDDPEKVEALIAELKAKQSDYDTSRFLPIFSSVGDQGLENARYLEKLLGLDKINWAGLSEEERDKLSDEMIDELMRILGEHNSSDDNKDDGLHEEMKKMQSENVGKTKIERRVLADL